MVPPRSRCTTARLLALLLPLAFVGCERASYVIINMTGCPIQVTYSASNLRASPLTLAPGKEAAFGSAPSRLKSLTVTARDGVPHTYDRADLERLRGPSKLVRAFDGFGWFDDGLRHLSKEPKSFPASDRSCTQ